MPRRTCFNPECNQVFDSATEALLCPDCLDEKSSEHSEPVESSPGVSLPVICLNPDCKKSFQPFDNILYCQECREKSSNCLENVKTNETDIAIVCTTQECRRIFYGSGKSLICPICEKIQEKAEQEKDDDAYHRIKEFLTKHPNASVDEVHIYTKVATTKIQRFLEEGKIQLVLVPKCSRCGNGMPNARFNQDVCQNCTDKLRHQLGKPMLTQTEAQRASAPPSGKERKYGFGRD